MNIDAKKIAATICVLDDVARALHAFRTLRNALADTETKQLLARVNLLKLEYEEAADAQLAKQVDTANQVNAALCSAGWVEQVPQITTEQKIDSARRLKLFDWWLDNIGRLSLGVEGAHAGSDDLKVDFFLNPPGKRNQFKATDVEAALTRIRSRLAVPQYGVR
jgi:hypothetical protein